MAVQVLLEELNGCKTYLGWLIERIEQVNLGDSENDDDILEGTPPRISGCGLKDNESPEISRELVRILLETDFTWFDDFMGSSAVKDDENRAKDALEVREKYAVDVGKRAGKSAREIDRIKKSIHGKASVMEVIFSLCEHLDAMVNEDETGGMIGLFYRILIKNLALDEFDDEDFDHRERDISSIWKARIKQFLRREYFESGCCGGLFPLQNWSENESKDQRKVSLWYQMNTWLGEHLDEDGRFKME